MEAAWQQAAADEPDAVVLNFEGAGYINSTSIAVIVGILARARAAGIQVRAYGLTPHYREIFEITRLADFMAINPDEDSAVSGALSHQPETCRVAASARGSFVDPAQEHFAWCDWSDRLRKNNLY